MYRYRYIYIYLYIYRRNVYIYIYRRNVYIYIYTSVCVLVYTSILYIYYVCLILSASTIPFSKKNIYVYVDLWRCLPSNKCNHRSLWLAAKAKGGRCPRAFLERFSSSNEDGNLGSLRSFRPCLFLGGQKTYHFMVYRSGYLWIFKSQKLEKFMS